MKLLRFIGYNLKRTLKNKLSLALTFILPIVVIFGVGFITGGQSADSRSYYLVNNDAGAYGAQFIKELSSDFNIKLLQGGEAIERLKRKTISEFYELGTDFTEILKNGERPQLTVHRREPKQGFSDFELKSGELLDTLVITSLVEKSSGTKLEPGSLGNNEVTIKVSSEKKTGIGSQMIVSLLISFNLFTAIGMCFELFALKSERTLRRSLTTPNTPRTVIGSLLGAQFILVALGYSALILIYAATRDRSLLSQAPIIIVNLFMTSAVAMSLSVFVARIVKNERLIAVVMQIILVGTCFVGGAFMPYEMLPKGITFLSKFTPQYWAIQSINQGRYEFSLIVLLFAAVLFTSGTLSSKSFAEI
jgi:ABC-2 type transport system permease protein